MWTTSICTFCIKWKRLPFILLRLLQKADVHFHTSCLYSPSQTSILPKFYTLEDCVEALGSHYPATEGHIK